MHYTGCWTTKAALLERSTSYGRCPGIASSSTESLTKRELEVLELLVQDLTYLQIAQQMGLQLPTVNTHEQSIYRKLGVHSRVQALRRVMQLKLI